MCDAALAVSRDNLAAGLGKQCLIPHCVSISRTFNALSREKRQFAISFVRGATYLVPDLLVRWILWGLLGRANIEYYVLKQPKERYWWQRCHSRSGRK